MAKIPAEAAKRVEGPVAKYMEMLKIEGESPDLKLINKPREDWLARTDLTVPEPDDTEVESAVPVLEIQKKTFKGDDSLLDRVIAHEMVHVRDYNTYIKDFPALTRDERSRRLDDLVEHGPLFHEGADRINAVMGPDYVMDVAFKPEDVVPEAITSYEQKYEQRAAFQIKFLGTLVFGGLVFLGAALASSLVRRQRFAQNQRVVPAQPTSMPPRPPLSMLPTNRRANERGNYGKK